MSVIYINPYSFSAPWTPAEITTALWLDAADETTLFTTNAGSTQSTNGTEVGRWNDKSGNARNATQATSANRPSCLTNALNGRQGVQFSSNARWLEVTDESPFDFTSTLYTFAVCSVSNVTNSNVLVNKGRSTFNNTGWYLAVSSSASALALIGITSNGSWSSVDINASLSANTPIIMSHEVNGSTVRARGNGTTYQTAVNNKAAWTAAANNDTLLVGAYVTSSSTSNFEGLAHQIIVMSSVPSLSIIEKLEGWAAHYYGLTANLPSGHPYKSAAPTI